MGLLDGGIKSAIAKAFRGKLLKGTLYRPTGGTVNSHGDKVGQTLTQFPVEGFVDEYNEFYRRTLSIPESDLRVTLIAGLMITRPQKQDIVKFTSGEYGGQYFQLRTIPGDPAGAHWECQAYEVKDPT